MDIFAVALWGLGGAFVYAAPLLLITLSDPKPGTKAWRPWADIMVSLLLGPIGAAGFTELIDSFFHWSGDSDVRATAVVIGMIANPLAPEIVKVLSGSVLLRLGGPLRKDKSE